MERERKCEFIRGKYPRFLTLFTKVGLRCMKLQDENIFERLQAFHYKNMDPNIGATVLLCLKEKVKKTKRKC